MFIISLCLEAIVYALLVISTLIVTLQAVYHDTINHTQSLLLSLISYLVTQSEDQAKTNPVDQTTFAQVSKLVI